MTPTTAKLQMLQDMISERENEEMLLHARFAELASEKAALVEAYNEAEEAVAKEANEEAEKKKANEEAEKKRLLTPGDFLSGGWPLQGARRLEVGHGYDPEPVDDDYEHCTGWDDPVQKTQDTPVQKTQRQLDAAQEHLEATLAAPVYDEVERFIAHRQVQGLADDVTLAVEEADKLDDLVNEAYVQWVTFGYADEHWDAEIIKAILDQWNAVYTSVDTNAVFKELARRQSWRESRA